MIFKLGMKGMELYKVCINHEMPMHLNEENY